MSCLIEFYLSLEQKDIETNNTTGRNFQLEFFTTQKSTLGQALPTSPPFTSTV